ncbi:MAG: class I poly(R)-hydroxyalkanoic acid synthase, partial [Comamonadaceae bacterium]
MTQDPTADAMFGAFKQALGDSWQKALSSFGELGQGGAPGGGANPWSLPKFSFHTDQLQKLQRDYTEQAAELWRQGFAAQPAGDKRFVGDAWSRNPMAAFSAAVYLLNARTMLSMVDAVDADAKTQARLRFAVEQWMAASAPSNYLAFNAEAQQKAVES